MGNRWDKSAFIRDLEQQVGRYMRVLENFFGARDPRFIFGSIRKSSGPPQLNFPATYNLDGGCVVDIHIGEWPWDNESPDQGPWQVAHECVHLLDPMPFGAANVLEEGLATWFQDEKEFHTAMVRDYIEKKGDAGQTSNYLEARNLIRRCMKERQFIPVVRELRSSGVPLSDITVDHLSPYLENNLKGIDTWTAEALCAKFSY